MDKIKIKIDGRVAEIESAPEVVTDNAEYEVEFAVDERDGWNPAVPMTALFVRRDERYTAVVMDVGETICTMPPQTGTDVVYIGLTQEEVRTTTPARIRIRRSVRTMTDFPPLPDKDVYEQILANFAGLRMLSGEGAPTTETAGKVNQLYRDEDTQKLYICTSTDGGYTWAAVVSDTEDAVTYTAQTLTEEQKTQARANIGAGTSNFSGSYNDLNDQPNIPAATVIDTTLTKSGQAADAKAAGDAIAQKLDKAQGVENAGMILGVDESGNVAPEDKPVQALAGTAAPTTTTAGVVGQEYYVIVNNALTEMYVCTAVANGTYTWSKAKFGAEIDDTSTELTKVWSAKKSNQLSQDITKLKEKKAEIDDTAVGANAWSSKNIIDMLCPPLEESGNPVVCYPVAGYPLGVNAKWEPTQEGSGTPYPAGGGKNLWGDLIQNTFISQNGVVSDYSGTKTTGKIPCTEGDEYTLSCATTFAPVPGNTGVLAYFDASDTMIKRQANTYQRAFTLKAPANVAYLRASCFSSTDADNVQLEKGSAATAYAPYVNIRPIKGRDSVTVERCGENLLPFGERIENIYQQQIMASDDFLILLKACAGQEVTLTFTVETQNIVFEDVEEEWRKRIGFECHGKLADGTDVYTLQCWIHNIRGEIQNNGKKTKTVTTKIPKIASGNIMFYAQNIKSGSFVAYDFGIYYGTTAPTTYTPYIGGTNTMTLPETMYGGEVDAVTGNGKRTWGIIDNYAGETIPREWISDRDVYSADKNPTVGAQVAYRLAEPVPFTATGAQLIPALAGVNTVLTDADSATVTGRADPIKRIEDLEEAVASIN